jgi:hypothetical protein
MKKVLVGLSFVLLTLVGCNALKKLTQFTIPYSTDFSVPPTPAAASNYAFNITTGEVNTDLNNQLKKNNTNESLLESVKMDEFKLTITSPAGRNFNILSSIKIFMQAQGLQEIEVAYKNNIDSNIGSELKLDMTGAELKNHLLKDIINFRIEGVTADSIAENIEIKADFKVFVDARILGF